MGVIKRGILGGFSNKVGNIVGSTWKGRAVVKSLPLSVANPRTTPQTNQRNKFAGVSLFASAILSAFVKPFWDRFSGNISGYNAFCKENITHFDNSGFPAYGDFTMSKGKMAVVETCTVVADVSLGTVAGNVTFPEDVTWGQNGETIALVILTSSNVNPLGVVNVTGDPTDVVAYSLSSSGFNIGDDIYVYACVKRTDGTQVSTSSLFQTVAIA